MHTVVFYISLVSAIVLLFLIPLGLAKPALAGKVFGKELSRLKLFVVLLVLFLAAMAIAILAEPKSPKNPGSQTSGTIKAGYFQVVQVIDGDTIKVDIDGKVETVRLIGIDAPEIPQKCFGLQAKIKARNTLQNQQIKLQADSSQNNRDKYGRLLRYVILPDGTNLNRHMITEGHAKEFTFKTDYKYKSNFEKAQKTAERNNRGLWSSKLCPS